MFLDQKLATLVEPKRPPPPAQDRLTELKSITGTRRDSTLGGKFSIGPADQPGFMVYFFKFLIVKGKHLVELAFTGFIFSSPKRIIRPD